MDNTAADAQHAQLTSAMDTIIDFVPNVFLLIDEDDDDDDPDVERNVQELRKNLADLIKQERKYKNAIPAIQEAKAQVDEGVAEGRFDVDVDQVFNDVKKQIEAADSGVFNVNDHPMMKKFNRMVDQYKHKSANQDDDNDVELMTMSVKHSIVDPITKQVMQDPVKNTHCGHSYERATILTIISRQSMKCPMPGCPNPQPIHKNHLIDDTDLKRQIQRSKETHI